MVETRSLDQRENGQLMRNEFILLCQTSPYLSTEPLGIKKMVNKAVGVVCGFKIYFLHDEHGFSQLLSCNPNL